MSPQKKVAETPGTLCSPSENQESGSQRFLLTRDETTGTGSAHDQTVAFQFG
jgi:hypothetical protein